MTGFGSTRAFRSRSDFLATNGFPGVTTVGRPVAARGRCVAVGSAVGSTTEVTEAGTDFGSPAPEAEATPTQAPTAIPTVANTAATGPTRLIACPRGRL
ncbi:hypothetical protein B4N89_05460 [Embleya scabrispora]|uniref:Uncharacterized protein n=1 Tax=Embleya scabrispora TaxID=159449 RepID=A0A1T3NUD7_9ACTN|nr:hypothetical protein [Embleya scabrispora]OPC80469.1 hypothetical protein B4N89_05460 [Embleya scabrispora]